MPNGLSTGLIQDVVIIENQAFANIATHFGMVVHAHNHIIWYQTKGSQGCMLSPWVEPTKWPSAMAYFLGKASSIMQGVKC